MGAGNPHAKPDMRALTCGPVNYSESDNLKSRSLVYL